MAKKSRLDAVPRQEPRWRQAAGRPTASAAPAKLQEADRTGSVRPRSPRRGAQDHLDLLAGDLDHLRLVLIMVVVTALSSWW